jgi:putative ABC transport system ATP-binding protein
MTSLTQPQTQRERGYMIEARDVYRSFGQTQALAGASLAVPRGEVLAVMGPSGSGKSTLLHCLAGIFPPDKGEIWFDGKRLDTMSDTRRTELRRTAFGFVFQFGQLVPELTVSDNIALPLLLNRVGRKSAYATANAWLPRLELDGLGGRRTGELSGGQAQRVALARALVGSAREEGATVVLVTHDARVAAYADREVLVRDGKVINRAEAEVEVGR